MNENALLVLLESVLGKGKKSSKGNYAFYCKFCNHHKQKLEIQLHTNEDGENPYHCWNCNVKGKKVLTLLKKVDISPDKLQEARLLTKSGTRLEVISSILTLPPEFISFKNIDDLSSRHDKIIAKHALKYVKQRGISDDDILKYNIGFCLEGKYSSRIIIPSYDEDAKLNYFTARSFEDEPFEKYKNPPVSAKDIIGFELFINYNAPVLLDEGCFDAIKFKRNIIPLFGKVIHPKLVAKLIKHKTPEVYICLDRDAAKDALKCCEQLIKYGMNVFLIEVDAKDFSESTNEHILSVLEDAERLEYKDLIQRKLQFI